MAKQQLKFSSVNKIHCGIKKMQEANMMEVQELVLMLHVWFLLMLVLSGHAARLLEVMVDTLTVSGVLKQRVLSATVQSAIIFVPNQAGWF